MRTELVTTLKRRATELLADVTKSHEPIVITEYGLPTAVLLDIESYDGLLKRITLLEGIARGERAVEDERTLGTMQARSRLKRWLK